MTSSTTSKSTARSIRATRASPMKRPPSYPPRTPSGTHWIRSTPLSVARAPRGSATSRSLARAGREVLLKHLRPGFGRPLRRFCCFKLNKNSQNYFAEIERAAFIPYTGSRALNPPLILCSRSVSPLIQISAVTAGAATMSRFPSTVPSAGSARGTVTVL